MSFKQFGFVKYLELNLDNNEISPIPLELKTKRNVIYAIEVDGQLVYIGKTKNLRKRINYYRTSMNRQTWTSDSTKSKNIYDSLNQGKSVIFYYRQCFDLVAKNDLGQMEISTMDLEEPIFIKMFNPDWNTQHKEKE
ncbi:endonuclease [Proteus phage phiP4-3]|uniref:Endonuclease II n=2 Tax=Bragavirus TaxID=2948639 RepID=A0A2I6PF90_9CAUD|nr:endonuclease [Proteus phage PM2]YP_010093577.1 endonuclease [Proteus phage phiP4-3]ASZ76485.1 endonuclease II [Proteus phage PM2]AUM58398.1 endonuclease II [Proteus phage phiP4-3]QQV89499.1 endonuclease II [Proteus phage SJ_PmiM]